jgi:hypothetical protein
LRVAIFVSAGNSGTAASSVAASGVRGGAPETCEHAADPASSSASFGLAAFQASNVLFHAAWAASSVFSCDAKYSRTSGET